MGAFDSKKDFIEMEHEILKFWEENQCFEKLRAKNKDNSRSGSLMDRLQQTIQWVYTMPGEGQ